MTALRVLRKRGRIVLEMVNWYVWKNNIITKKCIEKIKLYV